MRLFITVVLLLTHLACWCQPGMPSSAPVATRDATPSPPIVNDPPRTEVAVLEAQLEQMKQFEEKIIDMVCWSLAIACTFLVVNYLNLNNMHERDINHVKNSVLDEINTHMKRELASIRTELTADEQKRATRTAAERENHIRKIEITIIERLGDRNGPGSAQAVDFAINHLRTSIEHGLDQHESVALLCSALMFCPKAFIEHRVPELQQLAQSVTIPAAALREAISKINP